MKKTRTRLFASEAGKEQLILSDPDSLGVQRSLRLKTGQHIACFNGDGMEYYYLINDSSRNNIFLSLKFSEPNISDQSSPVNIYIAATKGKTKDRIVRDLPPLGVSRIVFFKADRSVCLPQVNALLRLRKIVIEACRQCGRSTIPEIEIHLSSLSELCHDGCLDPAQSIVCWEHSDDCQALLGHDSIGQDSACNNLIFGPEGGFSDQEAEFIKSKPFTLASLGKRILRTELAVVVGMVLLSSAR